MIAPLRLMLAALLLAAAAPAGSCPAADAPAPGPAPDKAPTPLQIEAALGNLRDSDWITAAGAMRVLVEAKLPAAAGPIRQLIASNAHPWIRGRALVSLAELLGEAALADVQAQTAARLPDLRAAAIEALGVLGLSRTAPAVRKALTDGEELVRCQAVVALARLLGKAAWDVVAQRLKDNSAVTVAYATRALAYVPTDEARQAVLQHLAHTDLGVRREAADVIRTIGLTQAADILLVRSAKDSSSLVREACRRALASFDVQTVAGPLIKALHGTDTDLYSPALKVLGLHPTARIAQQIAEVIRKPDARYARAASLALDILARVDPEAYKDLFVLYLDHAEAYARRASAAGLGKCKSVDHFTVLKPLLTETDSYVLDATYGALARATTGAPPGGILKYLAAPLARPDAVAFYWALDLLARRMVKAEVPAGLEMLKGALGGAGEEARIRAARSLAAAADDLGKHNIAAAQGYLGLWRVIGPFPTDHEETTFPYPPEWELDFAGKYEVHVRDKDAAVRPGMASCGGDARPGLVFHPPSEKGIFRVVIATYLLDLPKAAGLKLKFSVGLRDGARPTDGARFEVRLAGRKAFEKDLTKGGAWDDAELDLSTWAGRKLAVELAADVLEDVRDCQPVLARPRVVAGDKELIDLARMQQVYPVRVGFGDKKLPLVAWQLLRGRSASGYIDLGRLFQERGTGYALADLDSPADRSVRLEVIACRYIDLWLNGQKLQGETHWSDWNRGESRTFQAKLKKGPNRFFAKIRGGSQAFHFRIRVVDDKGVAVTDLANTTAGSRE